MTPMETEESMYDLLALGVILVLSAVAIALVSGLDRL
jgi:hypothetical protein